MRIRNETYEPLIVALRIEGYDDREERLEPGEESGDFVNLSDDIFNPEIITIEYPKEPVFVSEMEINGN